MAIIVDVSPEEEARFRARAERYGQDLSDYVASLLRRDDADEPLAPVIPEYPSGQTLADVLAGRVGTAESERGDLSQDAGKKFLEILKQKREAGRL